MAYGESERHIYTAAEIEAEQKAAIESITPQLARALARLTRATQLSHFNHHRIVENMQDIFKNEADELNRVEEEKQRIR